MASLFSWLIIKFKKLVDALLGRTKIFIIIFGWFLVATGVIMLLRPEKARKTLLGQGFGYVKWPMRILLVYLILLLLPLGFGAKAIWMQGLAWAVIILFVMGFVMLKKKAYSKLSEWLYKVPIPYLKGYACLQIVVGVLMLILQRRIW